MKKSLLWLFLGLMIGLLLSACSSGDKPTLVYFRSGT